MKGSVTKDYSAYKISTESGSQDLALVFGEGVDDEKYDFYWIPQFVLRATRQTNGEVTDEINVHSIPLPFTIEGYGVVGGFFFTKAPQSVYDLENANTSLLVYSNKGIKTYPILMNNTSREG